MKAIMLKTKHYKFGQSLLRNEEITLLRRITNGETKYYAQKKGDKVTLHPVSKTDFRLTSIPVDNVLKVIDINHHDVSIKTIDFLSTYYTAYFDSMENMGEDLLNIVTASEPDAMSKPKSRIVKTEIQQLAKLAEKHDAAYVRFIKY